MDWIGLELTYSIYVFALHIYSDIMITKEAKIEVYTLFLFTFHVFVHYKYLRVKFEFELNVLVQSSMKLSRNGNYLYKK